MEITFLSASLSLLTLLLISTWTFLIAKRIKIPYTVLLVIVWLLLIPLSKIWILSFINHFKLTPDLLFFVFLPVLLFESSYNIHYRKILKDWKAISILAIIWLLISSWIIATWLFFLLPLVWFNIPFIVCLLFWVIISATDPVAVLSIFKSVWAPRRLALIFEWESLFNDGTAIAMFLVVLWIIAEQKIIWAWVFLEWTISFLSMLFWGILFWWFMWVLFSKIIWWIKNNESLEITLTMILAHVTFLLAEFITHYFHHTLNIDFLGISGVIATVIAWIVAWNYWKYKISPKVEKHMEKFLEFFAFIANSLVFILMWLILADLDIEYKLFIMPILIAVLVVIISRWISVYLPLSVLNIFEEKNKIPTSWQHVLSWGSLRWSLAVMMWLMIPGKWDEWYEKILNYQESVGWTFSFDIKDFILVLIIWSVLFTLIIKATSISTMMRLLWITKLKPIERFEYFEWKIISHIKIINQINRLKEKWYITKQEYLNLKEKYERKLLKEVKWLKNILKEEWDKSINLIEKAISLYVLWIEREYLHELFEYNEIDEVNFKYILHKIGRQIERIEYWKDQFSWEKDNSNKSDYDIFERLVQNFSPKQNNYINKYIRNRARVIIIRKVIKELNNFLEIDFWFDKEVIKNIIVLYEWLLINSLKKKDKLLSEHAQNITILESNLTNKTLIKIEEWVIKKLHKRWAISPKLYIRFMDEIEEEIECRSDII